MKDYFWNFIFIIFPPVEFWHKNKAIEKEKRLEEYKESLKEYVDEYEGNLEELFTSVKETYQSEYNRVTHLDSKAGNYFSNIGVALSILGLAPLITLVIGVDKIKIDALGCSGALILLIFFYAVISLILSSYYSHKALKTYKYVDYYTADGMKDEIENKELKKKDMILDLLKSTRKNEIINLKKNNAISVAQSLSRNGLIGLGAGIIVMTLFVFF